MAFALEKAYRKIQTKNIQGSAAALAGLGSLVAFAVVLAGANAWNPLGWGLGVVAFLGGVGIQCYRLYRKVGHEFHYDKYGFDDTQFPNELVTAWEEEARTLSSDYHVLTVILSVYGVEPEHVRNPKCRVAVTEAIKRGITWT
jgi:hypothetical protein